jgi:chromatin modification-related protein EAF6
MYDAAKRELIGALTKKRAVDKALVCGSSSFNRERVLCKVAIYVQASLEAQLYAFEGSYLSETSNSGGNIITGFDSYLKGANTGGRRRHEVTDGDRMFSSSSTTYFRVRGLNGLVIQSDDFPRTVSRTPKRSSVTTAP